MAAFNYNGIIHSTLSPTLHLHHYFHILKYHHKMLHTSGNQFYTSSKFYLNNMTLILPINTLALSSTTSSSTLFPIISCRNYSNQQGSGNSHHNQNKYSHMTILTSKTKLLHLSIYFFQNFFCTHYQMYMLFLMLMHHLF